MKIVMLDGITINPGDITWQPVSNLGDFTFYPRTAPEDVVSRIGDAEAVLISKIHMTGEVMDACPNLKYIGAMATGYNNVDVDAAHERGIVVTNIPAYSTNAVAQFTMGLLMEITQRIGYHVNEVRNGKWIGHINFCYWDYSPMELAGKTLGVIGYGSIGQKVASMARAFDMKILYNSRHPKTDHDCDDCRYAPMEELLANSDIISLHCPLTEQTSEMVCTDFINKMKDGVILLNTSRGGLVKEDDLAEALKSGKVRAFGADVVAVEPMAADNPLRELPNAFITPHMAWAPIETRIRLVQLIADNLAAYQKGEALNRV
ncbi:MAG: D-2-hydroxyacid dehydrogenase [Lachnospiraceae bacterium]|nr:D-2-hydroxyacid dehydrogenase [Candidatus Equihabitans merdae]